VGHPARLRQPFRQRRCLMTIQAYIDDSGVKGTDPVFVLAGYIAEAEKWAAFSDAWKHHLSQSPSIRYLKMYEAAKLSGEFRFWRPEERDRKLSGCVDVINRFQPDKGVFFMNDLVAWEEIIPKMKVKTLADPHFHAFNGMISAICDEALDAGVNEEIEIIFDEHVIFGPRVSYWYPALKELIELTDPERSEQVRRVLPSSIMFRNDKTFVPLQAADILAWFERMTFRDRLPGIETVWRFPDPTGFEWLAEKLLASLPKSAYSTIWGHERIAGMNELSKEMRDDPKMEELLMKWKKRLT